MIEQCSTVHNRTFNVNITVFHYTVTCLLLSSEQCFTAHNTFFTVYRHPTMSDVIYHMSYVTCQMSKTRTPNLSPIKIYTNWTNTHNHKNTQTNSSSSWMRPMPVPTPRWCHQSAWLRRGRPITTRTPPPQPQQRWPCKDRQFTSRAILLLLTDHRD